MRGGTWPPLQSTWSELCDLRQGRNPLPPHGEADAAEAQEHHGPGCGLRNRASRDIGDVAAGDTETIRTTVAGQRVVERVASSTQGARKERVEEAGAGEVEASTAADVRSR